MFITEGEQSLWPLLRMSKTMVIREQVILYAKDLKANVVLLTANGKIAMRKIPL